jgi:hypothetical protein
MGAVLTVPKAGYRTVDVFAQKTRPKPLLEGLRISVCIAAILVLRGLYPTFAARDRLSEFLVASEVESERV